MHTQIYIYGCIMQVYAKNAKVLPHFADRPMPYFFPLSNSVSHMYSVIFNIAEYAVYVPLFIYPVSS